MNSETAPVPVIESHAEQHVAAAVIPRIGTPAKVAREIRESVAATQPAELPRYDWTICHVWSRFQKAPGNDEAAENIPVNSELSKADAKRIHVTEGVGGYTPATWCAERLPADIRVMCPEELVWRIRMKHNPEQTKRCLAGWEVR